MALTAIFNAGFAGAILAAKRSGRLPDAVPAQDMVLIGTASHKLSRLVAKDKVTSFFRAPFTEYQGPVGELLVCPYCLGLWASGALHAGLVFAPRVTRVAASTLAALTLSDFLQIGYKVAE